MSTGALRDDMRSANLRIIVGADILKFPSLGCDEHPEMMITSISLTPLINMNIISIVFKPIFYIHFANFKNFKNST